MVTLQVPGAVIGRPGGSLSGAAAGWAKNAQVAQIGQRGELQTAHILNRLATAPGGPTVFHDLTIPIPGFTANIDHVVVSGRTVTVLDSKVWKPGFYWTLGGTRRGLEPFRFADTKTLPTAVAALRRHLQTFRLEPQFGRSVLVVWPSSTGPMQMWAFRPQAAVAVPGHQFAHRARHLVGVSPADPRTVAALRALVR